MKKIKCGNTERVIFSDITDRVPLPDLLEIQKKSFDWLLDEGIAECLDDVSPIMGYQEKYNLEFVGVHINEKPTYTVEEAKEKSTNFSVSMKVKTRLINNETNEIKEQDVFIGEFPIMTNTGTFIINGAERVIVSQIARSAGPYYDYELDKLGNKLYSADIIPTRGTWIEYETDKNLCLNVRVDRTRKLPFTVLLRALGYGTDAEIINLLGRTPRLETTLEKDTVEGVEEALIELYKKLKPAERPTLESAENLINNMFFDPKRYDLGKVGRYKFNIKLSLVGRVKGQVLTKDVVNPYTSEIIANKGDKVTENVARKIESAGINEAYILVDGEEIKIIGNNFAFIKDYTGPLFDKLEGVNLENTRIPEKVHVPSLVEVLENAEDDIEKALIDNRKKLAPRNILVDDILATMSYLLNIHSGIGYTDDIDHLGNRRVKSVGELLQEQFRIGLSRMERVVKERLATQDPDSLTPQNLINIRPITASIKEFFGSNQLSQFMDQNNPLSELTHKRKLSALGKGGLSRDRAGFAVRDVHPSHYGRMCPIETPEGPNVGLITSLSCYARINKYGLIETPYFVVENGIVSKEIRYLTANDEQGCIIAQASEKLDKKGKFIEEKIIARDSRGDMVIADSEEVNYMDISSKQIVSVATSLIPFLENDDATRALMGSNMQRQAVPLIRSESPVVGTGIEHDVARYSGVVIISKADGEVQRITAKEIVVKREDGILDRYELKKFKRSNQGTTITQRAIVNVGDKVTEGMIIADGSSTDNGEIALGKNLLVGFLPWEGYNFEDAILLSEEIVREDYLTSIHIEKYEIEARDTKLGAEEITREIPNVSDHSTRYLDSEGIIMVGAEVKAGDILVGKVTPKGETEITAEEKLLRAIFGEKAREVRDTSLRVPHGEEGIVVDVNIFTRENKSELSPGVNKMIRIFIAKKRKISVGDKLAGRHGNKGVISRILPVEDMPYLEDGTPLQVVLTPLGLPSRMNIGQLLETHLGLVAMSKGIKVATPVFEGVKEEKIFDMLEEEGYSRDGRLKLYDGRTGREFDNTATVGYMYILKLHHLVDEKIHARSTGPYSLVTQQPLGGKAQFGGQRFGEMEVWALEAYGAAHTLQEILTVKSDDVVGRVKTYEAIVRGENIPTPGIPESFKVLIKELQSLCLDVKLLNDGEEIEISEK